MHIASQTEPLDDHDNHCLDAMVEYGEIDAATYMVMMLFADRKDINDILYGDSDEGWRYRVSEKLMRLADSIMINLPKNYQGCLLFLAIQQTLRVIKNHATILADWALTDMCEGGALEPFKRNYKLPLDYRILKKARRKLYSRKWIKRYIKNNKENANLKRLVHTIMTRMADVPLHLIRDDREIAEMLDHDLRTIFRRDSVVCKSSKGAIMEQKKVLKRSLKAAETFVSKETVKAFIDNKEISVEGKNLVLKATRTAQLSSNGHGAFSVSVHTKDDVFLARLCVYFEDTPVLDQLIGMVLFVSSGCEEEFIKRANVLALSEAGRMHPLFEVNAKALDEMQEKLKRVERNYVPYEIVRQRSDDYWSDTGAIWTSELSAYLLGRKCSDHLVSFFEERR